MILMLRKPTPPAGGKRTIEFNSVLLFSKLLRLALLSLLELLATLRERGPFGTPCPDALLLIERLRLTCPAGKAAGSSASPGMGLMHCSIGEVAEVDIGRTPGAEDAGGSQVLDREKG